MKHLFSIKSFLFALSLIVFFSSCGENNASNNAETNDIKEETTSTDNAEIPTEKETVSTFTGYKASSNDPYFDLKATKIEDNIYYELVFETHSQEEGSHFRNTYVGKADFNNNTLTFKADDQKITAKIEESDCQDAKGNASATKVSFSFDGTSYEGCGDFGADIQLEASNPPNPTEEAQYICFTRNDNKEKRIWLELFNAASKVKYEGQTEAMSLELFKIEMSSYGASPNTVHYYHEIYNGKVNGLYVTEHSGIWDYVTYKRGSDGKEFNFTIDHEADPYGKSPCF